MGITALDVRSNPANPNERAVYASVVNYSSNAQPVELELRLDDKLLETRPLTIAAGEASPQVFVAGQTQDGVFTVRINVKDDWRRTTRHRSSVYCRSRFGLLVTRGNRLLEKALRAVPNVELGVVPDLAESGAEYDFVVLDDVTPTTWPKGNVLAFHVVNTNWVENPKNIESPAIVDWKSTHPNHPGMPLFR